MRIYRYLACYSIAWVDHPLQEYINLELIIGDNLYSFIIPYRSPSQTHDDFETFIKPLS